jgi:hypothetical protein
MRPEIVKHDLSLSLSFDPGKDAWIVKLVKGKHELTTPLRGKMPTPVSRGFSASIREFKATFLCAPRTGQAEEF